MLDFIDFSSFFCISKVKLIFEMCIADREAATCKQAKTTLLDVITPRHYHWYAATRFDFALAFCCDCVVIELR